MDTTETFAAGILIVAEVLEPYGFVFALGNAGRSSGGEFASGQFVKADRILELNFRRTLDLVTYHLGGQSLMHPAYMQALLGRGGPNQYPGFSNDPLDGFRHLCYDLRHFCGDFLAGAGEEFRQCVIKAQGQAQDRGLKALLQFERDT